MPIVPVSPWAPDQAPLSGGTSQALNVFPVTQDSYGPVLAPAGYTNALDSACIGAFGALKTNDISRVFAGTATKLWRLNYGGVNFADVSGAVYSASASSPWRFAQFGNIILATQPNNSIQQYTLGSSSTFSQLSSAAPTAAIIAVVKDFVVLGNTNDPVGGAASFRIWWSALNDPTSWPTPGSDAAQAAQSDYNDIVGGNDAVMAVVTGVANSDAVVFYSRAMWRMSYVGPPNVFDFEPCQGATGLWSQDAYTVANGIIFYLGLDGFYSFDGATNTPIGAGRVDRWFFDNLNINWQYVAAAWNENARVAMWAFTSTTGTVGIYDTIICYSPYFDRWTYIKVTLEWLAPILGMKLPTSTDVPDTGAFVTTHELALFNGTPLAAEVTSQETQAIPGMIWGNNIIPGQRLFMQGVRPLVDGGSPTVAMASRNRLEDAQVIGADMAMDVSGVCAQRVDARYLQALIKVPAGASWNHCQGADFIAIPAGLR